jgi:acyl-CoA synthetase (AMP-forming)/AMP-acid ligase II
MPNVRFPEKLPPFEDLVDLLLFRAQHQPSDTAYIFQDYSPSAASRADEGKDVITYRELVADAQAIAGALQSRGLAGRSVLLLFPSGLDFIRAYFGCLLAGAHGIPLRPPVTPDYRRQLVLISVDSKAGAVLCPQALVPQVKLATEVVPELSGLQILAVEGHGANEASLWQRPRVARDGIALIQYTSGSTGVPKGVVVSHTNLLHNEAAIQEAFGHDETTIVVGWLPMFHDMGLIGNVLQPLYMGVPAILMDPHAFLQKPVRWLQLISKYRATTSGGPNFGYDLCVDRISDEDKLGLDLSSWTLAFSGAEPVRMSTLRRFHEAFEGVGFKKQSFYPCYGLAESTLFVTGIDKPALPTSLQLDPNALAENRVRGAAAEGSLIELACCGYPRKSQTVRIVDPQTCQPCADDQVGEIWLAGDSIAAGYLGREELTRDVFRAALSVDDGRRYLRTGDLGFTRNGQLYVSGRLKDLIIIRGRNHYPQDIEATASNAHPWLRSDFGVAFSVEQEGEERLVLVYQLKADMLEASRAPTLLGDLRAAIVREHGLQLHDLVFTKSVPKTSSGKLQRSRCRAMYESGGLQRV